MTDFRSELLPNGYVLVRSMASGLQCLVERDGYRSGPHILPRAVLLAARAAAVR